MPYVRKDGEIEGYIPEDGERLRIIRPLPLTFAPFARREDEKILPLPSKGEEGTVNVNAPRRYFSPRADNFDIRLDDGTTITISDKYVLPGMYFELIEDRPA